jgi:1-aminocyclopropane-1-carboxylate deaminase/D-cysteine desulfhydrase-like pyridoxal-dependent ACC family enzyme
LGRPSTAPVPLGRYPTPVERFVDLSNDRTVLWVKRDDRTSPEYGGNKVRKLERLLSRCLERGARRVLTVGAVGSHHVLATAYFGRKVGLEVEAVLVPQPRTQHVVDVLRAGLATGLRPVPVGSWAAVPFAVASRMRPGTAFVPIGGSNVLGSMGYVDAARELAAQVRAGALPEPDVCVVALGSGGTAAGLVAGFLAEGMTTRVVGVSVATPPWLVRASARRLTAACARQVAAVASGDAAARSAARDWRPGLAIDERFLGGGYGHATDAGEAATLAASRVGLDLDPTYTAKAFASALWHVRANRGAHVLYWHTLSSAPLEPLLANAPDPDALAPGLKRLAPYPL